MTEPQESGGLAAVTKKKVRRRGLLSGLSALGFTGVAVSAGVFGSPKPAAAGPLCCNLAHYPANTSYDYCYAHASYIWYCSASGSLHCSCCETAGNALSAADCRYN